MDIGKVVEIGERVIEVPQIAPQRAPQPTREPVPEREKEDA